MIKWGAAFALAALGMAGPSFAQGQAEPAFRPSVAFKTAVGATDADGAKNPAWEGDLDIGFSWRAGAGTRVVASLEGRDALSDTTFADITDAMNGITGVADGVGGGPFWRIEKFWVRQEFDAGRTSVTAGRLHFEDHVGENELSSRSGTAFGNEAFSAKPAISIPNNAMGAAVTTRLGERSAVTVLLGDAGREDEFDVFASGEVFGAVEVASDMEILGAPGSLKVAAWSRSVEDQLSFGEAGGVLLSASRALGEDAILMARLFAADADLRRAKRGAALAVARSGASWGRASDQAGLGVSVLEPSARGQDGQAVAEGFYRLQLNDMLALTPSLQWVQDDVAGGSAYAAVRLRFKR